MTISMYQASIPALVHHLTVLSNILKKAQADAVARKIDESVFITARLAPDMLPLVKQIQIATDVSKACPSRLTATTVPSYEDTETTFDQLQARIEKTITHLKSFKPEQINGTEDTPVTFPRRNHPDWNFKGQDYLTGFVLPNVYFHISIAYAILRHNGVQLGKADYLGL